ncbi:hypothetical protein JCM19232_3628 [Vibrio ishigakensis]|uniref:Uncharacterized protein n=1 Tax=Vibrio ishigakensis TaxID=1481914 RepID=A0A0B8P373_9VIBR|nr:hypothetical protein JCM19232_3628 [Vibrio ishigakensis]
MQQMFLENRTDEAYVEEFRSGSFRHHRETQESVLLSLFKSIWPEPSELVRLQHQLMPLSNLRRLL